MDTSRAATVTLPSDREIVITRVFAAPRAVVFAAWTSPEHVAHWWDPAGVALAVCEIDLRPGGTFRFVHHGAEGPGRTFTGTYREIDPPARIVFATRSPSGGESLGTLVFRERGGTTTLTLTIACALAEDRDALLAMGVDAGTVRTLDNLAVYLAAMRAAAGIP